MKIQTLGTYLVLFICLFSLSFASSNEPNYNELIKEINSQEETLIFSNFDNNTAIELGIFMVNKAKKQNKAVTVDISRNNQQLFHAALPGTAVDNDYWVKRKNEITNRTYKSSLKVWYEDKLYNWKESFNMTYQEMFGFNYEEACHLGGAFPLKVRGIGCIGTITVSGLPHDQDHAFLVECLKDFLKK